MSKSFVGSSRIKKFGFCKSNFTKKSLFRSPPLSVETGEYCIFPSNPNSSRNFEALISFPSFIFICSAVSFIYSRTARLVSPNTGF